QDSRFSGNLLYRNHAGGIALFREDGAAGSKNNVVVNNTIVMAADSRWAITIKGGSTGNLVRDNILLTETESESKGSINLAPDSTAGFASDFNLVVDIFSDDHTSFGLATWRQRTNQDVHSIIANPATVFIDPSKA